MCTDLEYTTDNLFTRFYPNTKAGEDAYDEENLLEVNEMLLEALEQAVAWAIRPKNKDDMFPLGLCMEAIKKAEGNSYE